MQKAIFLSVVLVGAASALTGCIPSEPVEEYEVDPASTVKTPEDLVEEWLGYAAAPDFKNPIPRPFMLIDQLSATSPTALAPCIEYLGKSDTSPESKVFVLQCITVNMTPAYLPYIEPLLDHENDDTRSCAYTLLGNILDPAVPGLLKKGLNDDVDRVQFSAMSGLAIHNVEPARSQFMAKYWEQETTKNQRLEIIRVIMKQPKENELGILADAMLNETTSETTRHTIAMIFGQIGKELQIGILSKSLEVSDDESYKEMVDSAIALIEERLEEASKG